MSESRNILLFSYGTLQLEEVQLESFGRLPHRKPDRLPVISSRASRSLIPQSSA